MPDTDKPKALHLPRGTLMDRLNLLLGQMVVVYLMSVHAPSIIATGPCPPYGPEPGLPTGGQGAGGAWAGPPLTPGIPPGGGHLGPIPIPFGYWDCEPEKPAPERGTAVVSGTLAFAGTDYLIIRVPHGNVCIDILIPYTAIGMIVVPPMMA